jgi:hypothetical protein
MAQLTTTQEIRISADAEVDRRTIRRFLAGLPIRPRGADRIRAVMKQLGIECDIPPSR